MFKKYFVLFVFVFSLFSFNSVFAKETPQFSIYNVKDNITNGDSLSFSGLKPGDIVEGDLLVSSNSEIELGFEMSLSIIGRNDLDYLTDDFVFSEKNFSLSGLGSQKEISYEFIVPDNVPSGELEALLRARGYSLNTEKTEEGGIAIEINTAAAISVKMDFLNDFVLEDYNVDFIGMEVSKLDGLMELSVDLENKGSKIVPINLEVTDNDTGDLITLYVTDLVSASSVVTRSVFIPEDFTDSFPYSNLNLVLYYEYENEEGDVVKEILVEADSKFSIYISSIVYAVLAFILLLLVIIFLRKKKNVKK